MGYIELLPELEAEGCILLKDLFSKKLMNSIVDSMNSAFDRCSEIQNNNQVGLSKSGEESKKGGDGSLKGAAHHVVTFGGAFLQLLEELPCLDLISEYLGGKVILNSYGAVANVKSEKMYEHAMLVHRDTRSFHESFRQTVWLIVMLDDFSAENGGTHILKRSQNMEFKPSDEEFFRHATQATGPAGSAFLYDGRVWHAAGRNKTDLPRRALTVAFSRPYVKQQLDYVRAIGPARVAEMSEGLKQMLGYYSRVPASLEEWYQKPEARFYQSDQG